MNGRAILPWHVQSFLKAPSFLLSLCQGTLVCGSAWADLCCEGVRSCECALGFHPLTPRLGSNFPDTFRWGRTSSPCPHHPASGPETWLSLGWGIIPILYVSGQGRHSCLFYPLTKARPARPAVSEFLWPGEALLPFLPPSPEGHAESASLSGATAPAPGQVKGIGVMQHWDKKAEGSVTEGQRALLFNRHDITAA